MTKASTPSAFAPLRQRAFALLWSAALVANIGTWFRDVANGWAMTELAPSPIMVALVQAAATLPVFLLSLPAGALADILDRRRLLLAIQVLLICGSLALAVSSTFGWLNPGLLLTLTAIGGIGAAMMGPPWQAIVPELVPKDLLRPAVALNSMGINLARAIGPAAGGVIIATFGVAMAYWLDALSYIFVIGALLLWRRPVVAQSLPPERFAAAIGVGLGYVIRSPEVQRALFRSACFFIFASAYWALLPLVARQQLAGGAALYGVLLTSIGAGAVTGALLLPRLNIGPDRLVLLGGWVTAIAMGAVAVASRVEVAAVALFVAGAAWIAVLTTLNVTAQSVLPNWVRARGLAVYITVFFGSMAAGSALWGLAAAQLGIPVALSLAAGGCALIASLAALVRLPVSGGDLTPSMHWPEPAVAHPYDGDRGPVMVQIVYRIAQPDRRGFLGALSDLSRRRRRDGAYGWSVFEDAADPERFTEMFLVPSWNEHLRQHHRVTRDDQTAQARVNSFHRGESGPSVSHHLAATPDDPPSGSPSERH